MIAEQGIDDVRIARIATLPASRRRWSTTTSRRARPCSREALEHSFELLGDLRTTHADDEGWTAARRLAWMVDQSLRSPGWATASGRLWLELWRQAARRAELRPVAARLYERYEDWIAEVVRGRDRRRRVRRGDPRGRAAAGRRDRRLGLRVLVDDPEMPQQRARELVLAGLAGELGIGVEAFDPEGGSR